MYLIPKNNLTWPHGLCWSHNTRIYNVREMNQDSLKYQRYFSFICLTLSMLKITGNDRCIRFMKTSNFRTAALCYILCNAWNTYTTVKSRAEHRACRIFFVSFTFRSQTRWWFSRCNLSALTAYSGNRLLRASFPRSRPSSNTAYRRDVGSTGVTRSGDASGGKRKKCT